MLSEVQGQNEAVAFLRRSVEGRFTSPLLLVGPEGIGRRHAVLSAAKEHFSTASDVFQISRGVHPDVVTVQPEDDKDIGIEAVRDLIQVTSAYPSIAPVRYVILDGADRLTAPAANAFLKTLEEPPSPTRFFLLAQDLTQVLPTIRSRCGLVRCSPLSEEFVVSFLRQHTDDAGKALVYARLAEGSVGRALQYLGAGRLALRDEMLSLLKLGLNKDISSIFSAVTKVGTSLRLGLRFLEHLLHDLVMLPYDTTAVTNIDILDELGVLHRQLGAARIERLVSGFGAVRSLNGSVNLAFHVKSYFANVFAE